MYRGRPRWEPYGETLARAPFPVAYNGDIFSPADLEGLCFQRQTRRPFTFEVRRSIESIADHCAREDYDMGSALRTLCGNIARLSDIFKDKLKRFNAEQTSEVLEGGIWYNLELSEQPCFILMVGERVELRNAGMMRGIMGPDDLNYHYEILKGIDYRLNTDEESVSVSRSLSANTTATSAGVAAAAAAISNLGMPSGAHENSGYNMTTASADSANFISKSSKTVSTSRRGRKSTSAAKNQSAAPLDTANSIKGGSLDMHDNSKSTKRGSVNTLKADSVGSFEIVYIAL